MSELLSKISSYNLYNYLLVGFVYNMLLCHYTQLGYVDESILKTLIVCYVMGLFIAKLASLFLEPLLIRLHWMHIPADTRSAFPVISVQSPVSIQCCWQS